MSNDVKDIEINGCITIPTNITHDEFLKKFIDFIEENNWCFGGGTKVLINGEYVDELCSALETIEYGESSGYPVSAFMENNVNFNYAVYDTEGMLKYTNQNGLIILQKNICLFI